MHWVDDDKDSIEEYLWILAATIMVFVLAGVLTVFNILVFKLFVKPVLLLILFYLILSIIVSSILHMVIKKNMIKVKR